MKKILLVLLVALTGITRSFAQDDILIFEVTKASSAVYDKNKGEWNTLMTNENPKNIFIIVKSNGAEITSEKGYKVFFNGNPEHRKEKYADCYRYQGVDDEGERCTFNIYNYPNGRKTINIFYFNRAPFMVIDYEITLRK